LPKTKVLIVDRWGRWSRLWNVATNEDQQTDGCGAREATASQNVTAGRRNV